MSVELLNSSVLVLWSCDLVNLGEEEGVKGQLLKVSHELSNSFKRQSSNKLPGILADCCLPRPSKVCVEHHTEGRKGCVTISEGFRQLQVLLMDGNYQITFHRGKEPAAACADGGSRSKPPSGPGRAAPRACR